MDIKHYIVWIRTRIGESFRHSDTDMVVVGDRGSVETEFCFSSHSLFLSLSLALWGQEEEASRDEGGGPERSPQ